MKTWDDDRHVLTAWLTGDPDYPIEFEVEHPQSCTVYLGCTGDEDRDLRMVFCNQKGHHVHIHHDCPIAFEIEAIGYDEALFALPMRDLMKSPPDHGGDLWVEARHQLYANGEARVPFKAHWWGGTDYWGEWDYGFEFEVKPVCTCPETQLQAYAKWHDLSESEQWRFTTWWAMRASRLMKCITLVARLNVCAIRRTARQQRIS
jgi:hypothetical protein